MAGPLDRPNRDRRHRADGVRQGPARLRALARVPGDLGRARRRRHRAERGRRAGDVLDGGRDARSTSPATSASATSRSSRQVGYGGGAGCGVVGPRGDGRRHRSVQRGGRVAGAQARRQGQPAVGAGEPAHHGSLAVEPSLRCPPPGRRDRDAHPPVHARVRRDPRAPRQRRAGVPQAREPQPGGDDARQAAHPRAVHGRPLDLRAAVPLRQLPRDRRRARRRDRLGRPGEGPPAAARVRPLLRAEHPAAAPGDDELLQRRPAARAVVRVRRAPVGAVRLHARTTSPSRSSTTRSARSSRCRSRATASASAARAPRSPTTARSSGPTAACPTNTAGGGMSEAYVHGFNLVLEGVRQMPRHVDQPGRRRRRRAWSRAARACRRARSCCGGRRRWRPTSCSPTSRIPTRPVLGRLRPRRAARAGVRELRRCDACRRGRCARAAARSSSAGSRRRDGGRSGRSSCRTRRCCPRTGARALQRDRRRARRGPDAPLRRQPRRRRPTARSTRSTRRRSRSASRCAWSSTRWRTSSSPGG